MLEVAIGGGEFHARLVKTPGLKRCVGVDLSGPMLTKSRSALKARGIEHPELCRADALYLPFGRAAFDILFNLYMLDLLLEEEVPDVLREFGRVLKPGGRLIILSMAAQARILNSLWMGLYHCSPVLVGGCRPLPIAEMLVSNGWRIDLQEQISQSGFRSELIVAQSPAESER